METNRSGSGLEYEACIQRRRLCAALRMTAAVVVAIVVVCAVPGKVSALMADSGGYTSRIWRLMECGKDIGAAAEEVGMLRLEGNSVPRWMLEEVLDEDWLSGAIANKGCKVVWLSKDGSVSEVRRSLEGKLSEKGWSIAGSDDTEGVVETFVKGEGECRWMLAEYAQAGAKTATVLHIEHS